MSLSQTVQAPVRTFSVGADEPWGGNRSNFNQVEQAEKSASFCLASRDVIDEARTRMARRGFVWE